MIEYWNNIALIADDTHFTKWVKQTGRLDHHQGFLRALEPYLGGVMLDIGANIGTHSIFYAQRGLVHCFEPNPIAYKCLLHNLRNSSAFLYNAAVGSEEGSADLVVGDKNYGAAFTTQGTSVPVITVDGLGLASCNYIKIDVEGDELAVLQGAEKTIEQFRPVLCVEVNRHTLLRKGLEPRDVYNHLEDRGYRCVGKDDHEEQVDVICLP